MAPVYPDTRTIPLRGSDKVALIDVDDYERVACYAWTYCETKPGCPGYALRYTAERRVWGGWKTVAVYMHRVIMDAPDGMQVDHRNHRTLDNRRCNLRLVTNQQNQHHRSVARNCKSGYKGVSQHKKNGNWVARIRVPDGPYQHLGCFDTPEEAARAYNAKALELFGEYAYLNVIPDDDEDGVAG